MKIATVVGARPQFIKAAAVSRVLREQYDGRISELLIHTGQHYDDNMSRVFFDDLDVPPPHYNLEVAGGGHGAMTGRMLERIETVLVDEKPDFVLVYGDTNSTLAGALAAAKLHTPVAHVEAGLRSFNMRMPEEVNRILTDRISALLFCPTPVAVQNLHREGVSAGVHEVGDVMYDVALIYGAKAREKSTILQRLDLTRDAFALVTCHRAENTDDPARLTEILSALDELAESLAIVFPLHPRTRRLISSNGLERYLSRLHVVEPLPFLDMLALEASARLILTDSGGVQKEAYFYEVPCITMRDETEWVETVEYGWNQLVGANRDAILMAAGNAAKPDRHPTAYGDGQAAQRIVELMAACHAG